MSTCVLNCSKGFAVELLWTLAYAFQQGRCSMLVVPSLQAAPPPSQVGTCPHSWCVVWLVLLVYIPAAPADLKCLSAVSVLPSPSSCKRSVRCVLCGGFLGGEVSRVRVFL
jgi:hypothetical protein